MRPHELQELLAKEVQEIPDRHQPELVGTNLRLRMHGRQGRRYRIQLALATYNIEAPRLTINRPEWKPTWDPKDWPPYPFTHQRPHPTTGRPFCCLHLLHEYRTHPAHRHESWDAVRNFHRLSTIVAGLEDALAKEK